MLNMTKAEGEKECLSVTPDPDKPMTSPQGNGVYIGPVDRRRDTDFLATHIFKLLVSTGLKRDEICRLSIQRDLGVAKIGLMSHESENFVIRAFEDTASLMTSYNLRLVTARPELLRAQRVGEQGGSAEQGGLTKGSNNPVNTDLQLQYGDAIVENKSEQSFSRNNAHAMDGSAHSLPKNDINYDVMGSSDVDMSDNDSMSDLSGTNNKTHQRSIKVKPGPGYQDNESVSASATSVTSVTSRTSNRATSVAAKRLDLVPKSPTANRRVFQQKHPSDRLESPPSASLGLDKTSPIAVRDIEVTVRHDVTNDEPEPVPGKVNVKTSTPKIPPCSCPETVFYQRLQYVGTETRHAEFKRGGVVNDQIGFITLVGKYMCGFLNSGGGILYLGVSDDGAVLGIEMTPDFEETMREDIVEAFADIDPPVDQEEFVVNFAKVMEVDTDGDVVPNLRVVEICVQPRLPPSVLYTYRKATYVRRDGSLQNVGRKEARVLALAQASLTVRDRPASDHRDTSQANFMSDTNVNEED